MINMPKMKRAAPDSDTPVDSKRPRTLTSKTPEVQKKDCAFEVSVVMDDKFRVFPERLRSILQEQHASLIKQFMIKVETGAPLQPGDDYFITRVRRSQPEDKVSDYNYKSGEKYPAASFANKEALKEFVTKVTARKRAFIQLEMPVSEKGRTNPAFAQLHSVRAGEIGWGFDKYECLSLHRTTVEGCRLRHESIYVTRRGVEAPNIEEDDDFQVVEVIDDAKA